MKCSICGNEISGDKFSPGYAVDGKGLDIFCYPCCGRLDREELLSTGKLHGYLENDCFTNWPGTFSIPISSKKESRNNFGARRTDFWLSFCGKKYHGVQVGDMNTCAWIKVIRG